MQNEQGLDLPSSKIYATNFLLPIRKFKGCAGFISKRIVSIEGDESHHEHTVLVMLAQCLPGMRLQL